MNGHRLLAECQLQSGDIVHFADLEFHVGERRLPSQEKMYAATVPVTKGDFDSGKYREFREMLATKTVEIVFQPLVKLNDLSILGYESLGRGVIDNEVITAPQLFVMAETVGLPAQLSRLLREKGTEVAEGFSADTQIFVNTHPAELKDVSTLLDSLTQLRQHYAHRPIVLEIHESAATGPVDLQQLRDRLVELNINVAFDDFGVGQARLVELSEAAPQYLKFDASLIHNIHRASKKRCEMLKTLVHMAIDLDIIAVAEGIEKQAEADLCKDLGFEYGQGFLFGYPLAIEDIDR